MSVVCRREILRRIGISPERVDSLIISPLDVGAKGHAWPDIDFDSIDLHLGSRFLVPRLYHCSAVSYGHGGQGKDDYETTELMHKPTGQFVVIPAHGTVLGSIYEYIKLPFDISGQVLTRSSLARRFVTIATAPWVHPLYRGCLTLEMVNSSDSSVSVQVGEKIAQLVLFHVRQKGGQPRDEIEAKYLGPVFPEIGSA